MYRRISREALTFHNLWNVEVLLLADVREVVWEKKTGWLSPLSFREFHSAAILDRCWQQSHVLSRSTALLSQCVSVLWTILRHINLKIYLCPFYLHVGLEAAINSCSCVSVNKIKQVFFFSLSFYFMIHGPELRKRFHTFSTSWCVFNKTDWVRGQLWMQKWMNTVTSLKKYGCN